MGKDKSKTEVKEFDEAVVGFVESPTHVGRNTPNYQGSQWNQSAMFQSCSSFESFQSNFLFESNVSALTKLGVSPEPKVPDDDEEAGEEQSFSPF